MDRVEGLRNEACIEYTNKDESRDTDSVDIAVDGVASGVVRLLGTTPFDVAFRNHWER